MKPVQKVIELKEKPEGEHQIVVTHITIRQSIFFLVLKLFTLEFVAAIFLIVYYIFVLTPGFAINIPQEITNLNIPIFIIAVILKSSFLVYIIVSWLEEYYEISPKEILHRKGYIVKKEVRFTLDHVGALKLEQDIFGRIFNYGTLRLYDWVRDDYEYLYLVHNPLKYYHILKTLLPDVDVEEKMLRRNIVEVEED